MNHWGRISQVPMVLCKKKKQREREIELKSLNTSMCTCISFWITLWYQYKSWAQVYRSNGTYAVVFGLNTGNCHVVGQNWMHFRNVTWFMYCHVCCNGIRLGSFWSQMRMYRFHLSSTAGLAVNWGRLPGHMLFPLQDCPHLDDGHCGVCFWSAGRVRGVIHMKCLTQDFVPA